MDENFSPRVKDVIGYSKEEALRLGHDSIGTEHLVLGLIREGAGSAIELLQVLGVDLLEVRHKIEGLHQAVENPALSRKNIPLTRQAEKALKTTFLEAKLYGSPVIRTAHLLLCILRNENDPVAAVLRGLGIDYETLKNEYQTRFMEERKSDRGSNPSAALSGDDDDDEPTRGNAPKASKPG